MTSLANYWQTTGKKLTNRLSALPISTTRNVIGVILVIWVLFSMMRIVQAYFPSSEADQLAIKHNNMESSANIAQHSTVNLAKLQSLNLFGIAGQQEPEAVNIVVPDAIELNATKTKLNLSLEGVVSASKQNNAIAFIVYQGKQDQYSIGDKLPVKGAVKLLKVMTDHVIIENSGRYESLWLYDKEKNAQVKNSSGANKLKSVNEKNNAQIADKRMDKTVTTMAKDYRQRLYKNPRSLSEVLRISPTQKNGQLIGYKVSPGKDRQQFSDLGFEPNDVVTSINGISLDEPSKALEIYKLMRTAKEASFLIERDGSSLEIMVSLEDSNS